MKDALLPTRDRTVDAAKGIGILLVVFAHLNEIQPVQNSIYAFHIPLFFLLSGLFFRPEKYPKFTDLLRRRLKTLLLPYLFFAFASVGIQFLVGLITRGFSIQLVHIAGNSVISIFWARYSLGMNFNVALWFVPCLFVTECLFWLVSKIRNRAVFCICIAVLTALGWFTESAYCPVDCSLLPWNISSALFALGFFAAGYLSHSLFIRFTQRPVDTRTVLCRSAAALVCLAAIVPLAVLNGHVTIGSRILGNGFVFYVTGLLGSAAIVLLASLLRGVRPLQFLGRNSFAVMATHRLIQDVLFALYEKFFGSSLAFAKTEWVPNLIVFALILLLSVLCVFAYNAGKKRLEQKFRA